MRCSNPAFRRPCHDQDDGLQPLRWIGQRTVAAQDNFAPIRIRANTFGTHDDLMVSPEHRVLIRDNIAELLFGEQEILVSAKDLVNDRSVTRCIGGDVTYVHLMFDRHQVVSYPDQQLLKALDVKSSMEFLHFPRK